MNYPIIITSAWQLVGIMSVGFLAGFAVFGSLGFIFGLKVKDLPDSVNGKLAERESLLIDIQRYEKKLSEQERKIGELHSHKNIALHHLNEIERIGRMAKGVLS